MRVSKIWIGNSIRRNREPESCHISSEHLTRSKEKKSTMAPRPQANGTAERMVQMISRAIKMHVADVYKIDWDEHE